MYDISIQPIQVVEGGGCLSGKNKLMNFCCRKFNLHPSESKRLRTVGFGRETKMEAIMSNLSCYLMLENEHGQTKSEAFKLVWEAFALLVYFL